MSSLAGKYFIKQGTESYQDVCVKWEGLEFLKIDDFLKQGKAKNIYIASWNNSNIEDVFIPDVVCFENPDISFTFRVSDYNNHNIDVSVIHDDFINYIRTHKVTIYSKYDNKEADFVCQESYEPTSKHLKRQAGQNYILGTITLHRVTPTNVPL